MFKHSPASLLAIILFSVLSPCLALAQVGSPQNATEIVRGVASNLAQSVVNETVEAIRVDLDRIRVANRRQNKIDRRRRLRRGGAVTSRPAVQFTHPTQMLRCGDSGMVTTSGAIGVVGKSGRVLLVESSSQATYAGCQGISGSQIVNGIGTLLNRNGTISGVIDSGLTLPCADGRGVADVSLSIAFDSTLSTNGTGHRTLVSGSLSFNCSGVAAATCSWKDANVANLLEIKSGCSN